jgi:hypothetical protein
MALNRWAPIKTVAEDIFSKFARPLGVNFSLWGEL